MKLQKIALEFNRLFVTISTSSLVACSIAIILMNLFALHPRIEQPSQDFDISLQFDLAGFAMVNSMGYFKEAIR